METSRQEKSNLEVIIQNVNNYTNKYCQGSLGAIELSKTRYLILVSKKYLKNLPRDILENDINYGILNIAYSPATPNKY